MIRQFSSRAPEWFIQFAQLQSMPDPPPPSGAWYHRIIDDPVNLISISLAVIAVILGIIPLLLFIVERRRSALLDQTVKEFSLLDKIRELHEEETQKRELSKAELDELENKARGMREEIEKKIPTAALTAYYETLYLNLSCRCLTSQLG